MESDRLPRKLVAVLYADVAGYSRLTEADEDATHRRLREYLDHFATTIAARSGRVIHYAGDAVLATFDSAVDALTCAAQAQTEFSRRNGELPEDRRVHFRVGLNLGDVIEDRGDVYGDGVNVAARLESLAEPGGICISGSFHDAIGARLPFDYEYLGEQQVKNIRKPVRAYRARLSPDAELPAVAEPVQSAPARPGPTWARPAGAALAGLAALGLASVAGVWYARSLPPEPGPANHQATDAAASDNPTIVVMPFANLSADPAQTYFAEGITADLTTDLSRLSNLTVMAQTTSLKLSEEKLTVTEIGARLGVSHVLEGSVRKAGDQLRITGQLVDARDGHQVWAERYDRRLTDVFALQDEVVRSIVSALAIKLTVGEKERLTRDTLGNFAAYDAFLRGQSLAKERSRQSNAAARAEFEQAIAKDPTFARAYGSIAVTLASDFSRGFTDNPVETIDRAIALAEKAVAIDRGEPRAYWALGFVLMFVQRHEEALAAVEHAVAIAPNYADGYGLLALIHNNLGHGEKALALIRKAIALNPYHTWDYPYNLGRALYLLGRYEEALPQLQDALQRNPNAMPPRVFLIATLVKLGRTDDASWEADQLAVQYPQITLSTFPKRTDIRDKAQLETVLAALREAGMPE